MTVVLTVILDIELPLVVETFDDLTEVLTSALCECSSVKDVGSMHVMEI